MAAAHAAYPSLVLAEPVYDGFILKIDGDRYDIELYSGGGACCWSSVQEALSSHPQLLLHVPQ